jgi:hypothetical protein
LVHTATTHHHNLDKTRLKQQLWQQKPEVIKRAAEEVFDKIWKSKDENARDAIKGFTYGSRPQKGCVDLPIL